MSSSSSTAGPSSMRCAPIVGVRTEECLDEMKKAHEEWEELANVIILIGRTGVGKSALLEYLTSSLGHSQESPNPVTLQYQLETVKLNGKRYYIMDTPGFDTNEEQYAYREIIRGIGDVRPYARIIGVMLVSRIDSSRIETLDNRLVHVVARLCGPEYAAQITAVTNFWSVSEPQQKAQYENRLDERLRRWMGDFGQEMKHYQHGRRYNSSGVDAGECLMWHGDSDEIKAHAKAMVVRHYGGSTPGNPRVVTELDNKLPYGRTTAGEFLGITVPPLGPSPPSSSSSQAQQEPTTTFPGTSEPEVQEVHSSSSSQAHQETPASPPSTAQPERQQVPSTSASSSHATPNAGSTARPNPIPNTNPAYHADDTGPSPVVQVLVRFFASVTKSVAESIAQRALNNMATNGPGGAATWETTTVPFPAHLGTFIAEMLTFPQAQLFQVASPGADTTSDPNSSRDQFSARGMDPSLKYRSIWATEHGITSKPGSYDFGVAVLNAIKREPL